MSSLTEIFGDDSVLQFGGRTLGHLLRFRVDVSNLS